MDDLIKICDELEKCRNSRSCYSNRIVCAKSKLKRYIGGDFNRLLKLKAQIKIHNNTYDDLGMISLLVSAFTLCLTIIKDFTENGSTEYISTEYVLYSIFALVIISILCIISSVCNKKYGYRDKWKRYIEVALEDMEEEYKKNK